MNDTIDVKRIEDSGAPADVTEVYRKLKKFMEQSERRNWLETRKTNWEAAYESKIWTDKEKKEMTDKGMIPLAINDLYKGIQGSAAVCTDQRPGVQFVPIGEGDLYVAELMKRAHDKVWSQNDGQSEVFELVKEAKCGAMGVIEVKHNPGKGRDIFGRIEIGTIRPTYLYYDMRESRKGSLEDTDIIKAQLVTKAYARENYDLVDEDLDFIGPEKDQEASDKDDYKTGEDNYIDSHAKIPGEEDNKDVWEIEAHLLKKSVSYVVMAPDENGEMQSEEYPKEQRAQAEADAALLNTRAIKRVTEKRVLRIVVGKKLIEEIENPYGVDSEGEPILNLITLVHDKTDFGTPVCPTNFARESCRERNKRRMQSIYIVSKNVDAPIMTGEGYKWVADKVHGDMLIVPKDAAFPPGRLTPGATSVEAFQLEQVAKQDIDEYYDMQDVMKGKVPQGLGSQLSGRLVLALQDMAGTMSKPFIRNLESALERIGKAEMSIILKTWTRKAWERLIEKEEMGTWIPDEERQNSGPGQAMGEGEGPQPDAIMQRWQNALDRLAPSDPSQEKAITMLGVDVKVIAGSTMPTNRMAKQAIATEMVAAGIYDARAALSYIDDPMKDQIAQRMEEKEKAMMEAGMMKGAK